jgi:hypothetical protein
MSEHATGKASPLNVSSPIGMPPSVRTAVLPGATSNVRTIVSRPATEIRTHATDAGTAPMASDAVPTSSGDAPCRVVHATTIADSPSPARRRCPSAAIRRLHRLRGVPRIVMWPPSAVARRVATRPAFSRGGSAAPPGRYRPRSFYQGRVRLTSEEWPRPWPRPSPLRDLLERSSLRLSRRLSPHRRHEGPVAPEHLARDVTACRKRTGRRSARGRA